VAEWRHAQRRTSRAGPAFPHEPRFDATAILELLKNPLRWLFRKASLAGAPDDYGNNSHGSLRLKAQSHVERIRPADATPDAVEELPEGYKT
jgi:hypothetical protein